MKNFLKKKDVEECVNTLLFQYSGNETYLSLEKKRTIQVITMTEKWKYPDKTIDEIELKLNDVIEAEKVKHELANIFHRYTVEEILKLWKFTAILDKEEFFKGLEFVKGRKLSVNVKQMYQKPATHSKVITYLYIAERSIEEAMKQLIYDEKDQKVSRTTRWRVIKYLQDNAFPNANEIYKKMKKQIKVENDEHKK